MNLVGGVFDPLHAGHIEYLRVAHGFIGGPLLCVVSDAPAKHPPLVPLEQRMEILRSIFYVGMVVTGSVADAIRDYRPQHYIKGPDWIGRIPDAEVQACEDVGCQIVHTDTAKASSSRLLRDYVAAVNAEAVTAFEQFVHRQAVAQPWTPVTDYSLEGRRKAEGKHPQLIKDVFQPECVLDYGAGFGSLVVLLRELGVRAYGYEPYLKLTKEAEPNLATSFITQDNDWHATDFDVVICREVLEHVPVRQMRSLVQKLVRCTSKYIYVTTRFNESPKHWLDIQDHDDLDPTHISLLPKDLLRSWFVAEGCKSRPDLEAQMDWQGKGRCLVFEVA